MKQQKQIGFLGKQRWLYHLKTVFFILFWMCISTNLLAQEHEHKEFSCGTEGTLQSEQFLKSKMPEIKKYEHEYFEKMTRKTGSQFQTKAVGNPIEKINYLPLKINIFRQSDGTNNFTEQRLNENIAKLNQDFAPISLQFYICGEINYVDDNDLYNYTANSPQPYLTSYYEDGVINVFITRTLNGDGGFTTFPGQGSDYIFLMERSLNSQFSNTFSHEMGHFYGLRHTFETEFGVEYVNGSNCDVAGDLLCDTPPDPRSFYSDATTNASVDLINCSYIGDLLDPNGDPYGPEIGLDNIMSYYPQCANIFTPQQYARMQAFYQIDRNNFSCSTLNANFTVETESCNGLTASFTTESTDAISWEWDVDGDGVVDYTTQNPTHTYNTVGLYDITLRVSDGITTISKSIENHVQIGGVTLPYSRNFDDITDITEGGWTVEGETRSFGYTWNLETNWVGSQEDAWGPSGDNSEDGNGNYIAAYLSTQRVPNTSYISPCINIDVDDAELSFAYHMYTNINNLSLHVDIDTGNGFINDIMPPLVGRQQNSQDAPYKIMTIDLSAYAGQIVIIRFREEKSGDGFTGFTAIDDIEIKSASGGTNSCEELIQHTGVVSGSDSYNALLIESEGTFENNAVNNYFAADNVLLTNGFFSGVGSDFLMRIQPCDEETIAPLILPDQVNTLSTSEVSNLVSHSVEVTPNPNNGIFKVYLNSVGETHLQIINSNGNMLMERDVTGLNETDVNISAQPAGVYYVRIVSEVGSTIKSVLKK